MSAVGSKVSNLRPLLRIPNETGERMQVGCGHTSLPCWPWHSSSEQRGGGTGELSPGVGRSGLLDSWKLGFR